MTSAPACIAASRSFRRRKAADFDDRRHSRSFGQSARAVKGEPRARLDEDRRVSSLASSPGVAQCGRTWRHRILSRRGRSCWGKWMIRRSVVKRMRGSSGRSWRLSRPGTWRPRPGTPQPARQLSGMQDLPSDWRGRAELVGPELNGVVGRKAGAVSGYDSRTPTRFGRHMGRSHAREIPQASARGRARHENGLSRDGKGRGYRQRDRLSQTVRPGREEAVAPLESRNLTSGPDPDRRERIFDRVDFPFRRRAHFCLRFAVEHDDPPTSSVRYAPPPFAPPSWVEPAER